MSEDHVCSKEVQISEIHNIVTRRADDIAEIKKMLTSLDTMLRGNGKPGIATTLAVMKNTVGGVLAINVMIVAALIKMWVDK